MAKKNEAKIKFTAETQEFSNGIKKANQDISSMKSELRLNAVEMRNNGTSVKGLAEKQQLLQKQQAATKEKTRNLEEQLKKAKSIFGEDSQEVAKLTQKLNASRTAELNLDKQLKETNDALKQQKKNLGLTEQQAEKFKSGIDKVGNSAGIVAGTTVALGAGAVKVFNEVDKGSDAAIVATGATGEAAEKLKKTYKNVAGSVKGEFEVIGSALGEVETRFEFTDKKAEDCTIRFMKFAEVNGVDATQSVRLVSRAMGDAGIQADEYETVLDQLTVAAQASGIGVSNLAESLAKYGAPMRNLGFDTKESIALFAQWEKAGVNTSIAFSGMKKAISNWGKDGKDARVEFKKTLEEIQNTPDIASATTKAIEVFGAKAGPDLADAIKGGRFEYTKFLKVLDKSEGSLENTYDAIHDGSDEAEIAMQNLKIAGSEVGEALLKQLNPAIENVVKGAKEFAEYAEKHGDEIVTTMKTIGVVAGTTFAINKTVQFGRSLADISKFGAGVVKSVKAMALARAADTTATEAQTVAQNGLNASMLASPVGLTIASVTALAAGIYILANNTEQLSEESKKAISDMEGLNSSISESNESIQDEYGIYERQIEQLNKIVDKNGKVKKGKEDLAQAIVNNFEKMGIEIDYVDGQIQGYKDLKREINKTIEAKKAEAYLEANKDDYVKAMKQEKEYAKKIADQKERINKLSEEAEETDKKTSDFNQLPEKYPIAGDIIQIGAAITGQDPNQKSKAKHAEIEKEKKVLKDYENTYKNATVKITNYDKLQIASASGKTEKIKNATNAWEHDLKRASNSTKQELEKQLEDTESNVRKMEDAYKKGSVSKAAVDEAKRTRDRAKKELEKANYKPEAEKGLKTYTSSFSNADVSKPIKKFTSKIKNQLKNIGTINMGVNLKIKAKNSNLNNLGEIMLGGGVAHNAKGNIIKNPILTTFAEDGPEAAIPINNKPRSRALWIETGRMMGMINTDMGNRSISNAVNMNETNRLLRQLVNKDNNMYVDSMKVSKSTSKARNVQDGMDAMLVGRGVSIE